MEDFYAGPSNTDLTMALTEVPGESCGQCCSRQSLKISILFVVCGGLISAAGALLMAVMYVPPEGATNEHIYIIGLGLVVSGLVVIFLSFLIGGFIYSIYASTLRIREQRQREVPIAYVQSDTE